MDVIWHDYEFMQQEDVLPSIMKQGFQKQLGHRRALEKSLTLMRDRCNKKRSCLIDNHLAGAEARYFIAFLNARLKAVLFCGGASILPAPNF